jgi:hypothetical protein
MKAIMVVFVRTRDAEAPTGQPLALPIGGNLRDVAALTSDKTNRADKSTIHNKSVPPPFWTWFVENPRPFVSRRLRSLANLILSA